MDSKPGKFQYMLIGGIVSTLLTVIPCISLLNCCFCLGIGAGSYMGFRMWIRSPKWLDEPTAASGDAAVIGLGAGVIAGVLTTIINSVFQMVFGNAMMSMYIDMLADAGVDPSMLDMAMAGGGESALIGLVSGLCINTVLYGIFGAVWALVGANLFHKDQIS